MIGKYNKSVILTYIGVCLSIAGIALVYTGMTGWAMICLVFAGICDLFDGVVARRCKRTEEEKQFGIQIDSMADMISFVAFPVVLGMSVAEETGIFVLPVMMIYSLCGIIRLAWFNMTTNAEGSKGYYAGLPVTYAALILPILWLLEGLIGSGMFAVLWLAAYIIIAFLFVLNVRIRKPGGIWYGIFGVTAIVVTVIIACKELL